MANREPPVETLGRPGAVAVLLPILRRLGIRRMVGERCPRQWCKGATQGQIAELFLRHIRQDERRWPRYHWQAWVVEKDLATKQPDWHVAVFPGAQGYNDLCLADDGLVYGIADSRRFFVFDAAQRAVVYQKDVSGELGGISGGQGPRIFVRTPDKRVYLLFGKGIVKLDPKTYALKLVATSPVPVSVGGDYFDGRIYFASGSHVYSWKVPAAE